MHFENSFSELSKQLCVELREACGCEEDDNLVTWCLTCNCNLCVCVWCNSRACVCGTSASIVSIHIPQ
jgi:hypothetical protein